MYTGYLDVIKNIRAKTNVNRILVRSNWICFDSQK